MFRTPLWEAYLKWFIVSDLVAALLFGLLTTIFGGFDGGVLAAVIVMMLGSAS